jgi:hypothetical protein
MKLDEAPARGRPEPQARSGQPPRDQHRDRGGRDRDRQPAKPREREPQSNGVMAEALARALKR